MNCLICGGTMEEKEVTIFRDYEDRPGVPYAIIKDVPAKVCRQCGETVYTAKVVEKLQALSYQVKKGVPARRTVEVPVYSLRETAD